MSKRKSPKAKTSAARNEHVAEPIRDILNKFASSDLLPEIVPEQTQTDSRSLLPEVGL